MSKYKTTKKAIKKDYGGQIYYINDGGQFFRCFDPFAYCTRAEGWACDFYDVGGVCICQGYAPMGKYLSKRIYDKYIILIDKLYNRYKKNNLKYETYKNKQYKLYEQLANEIQQTKNK